VALLLLLQQLLRSTNLEGREMAAQRFKDSIRR
jgi:hypothetical protein